MRRVTTWPDRSISWRAFVVRVPVVLTPFPDVAMDLIEAPGVGLKTIDGNGALAVFALLAAAKRLVAVVIGLRRRDAVAPPERGGGAGSRRE